jgi:hypothetical protein
MVNLDQGVDALQAQSQARAPPHARAGGAAAELRRRARAPERGARARGACVSDSLSRRRRRDPVNTYGALTP